jgi:hypothetical protein
LRSKEILVRRDRRGKGSLGSLASSLIRRRMDLVPCSWVALADALLIFYFGTKPFDEKRIFR